MKPTTQNPRVMTTNSGTGLRKETKLRQDIGYYSSPERSFVCKPYPVDGRTRCELYANIHDDDESCFRGDEAHCEERVDVGTHTFDTIRDVPDELGDKKDGAARTITKPYHGAARITTKPYHGAARTTTKPYHGAARTTTKPYHGAARTTTKPYHGATRTTIKPYQWCGPHYHKAISWCGAHYHKAISWCGAHYHKAVSW